jgi:upstream activation factor subunit UAF30
VYIKEKNLQNPANKREILCDDLLKAVCETDKIDSFQMAKFVSKHVTKCEETPAPETAKTSEDSKSGTSDKNLQSAVKPKKKEDPESEAASDDGSEESDSESEEESSLDQLQEETGDGDSS